jgi:hypothetical protein
VSLFMFCAPRFIFGGTEGVESRFLVLRTRPRFQRCRGRRVPFSFFGAPGIIFGATEAVGYRFHVLRAWTRFRRYQGRSVAFSCFAHLNSFSELPRASVPVFMFCAPGLIFVGTKGVGSRFHLLRARPRFRRCRGRWVPFSCFGRLDSFSAVPRASGPVFMFGLPGLISYSTEGVRSRFQVLRS